MSAAAVASVVAAGLGYNCPYPLIYDQDLDACRAAKVLVLFDSVTTLSLDTDLATEGFDVTNGGSYFAYAGTDFSAYDTILWLEGANHSNALLAGVDAAIAAFVAGGGGLVRCGLGMRTETSRRNSSLALRNPECALVLPVIMPVALTTPVAATGSHTYNVERPSSKLAYEMDESVSSIGGYTILTLDDESVRVASFVHASQPTIPVPVLSYTTKHGGCTAFYTDLWTFGGRATLSADVKQAFMNAVWITAQRPRP